MSTPHEPSREAERRSFVVTGMVQGVGFRPFVSRLAQEFGLAGFVLNRAGEVHVEAEGALGALEGFERALLRRAPPLAFVAGLRCERLAPDGRHGFSIVSSEFGSAQPFIVPDAATCEQCLSELFDPTNRRHGYPFSNCTECGPRLTIIEAAPYDRARTTMRGFPLCSECQAEYEDPSNRRFHAEPTACASCGPRLTLLAASGSVLETADPVLETARALLAEQVVAVKGVGGFHLACLASSEQATEQLRRRKGRDEKPFAILVRSAVQAGELCELNAQELALLEHSARPIVLARRRSGANIASSVAGASPLLGVMLAHSPLQHLLCQAVADAPLVMTSGNPSHEPIAYQDEDAQARLSPLADCMLTHNRPIHLRCDDSVVRLIHGAQTTLRRARGLAPRPTPLGQALKRPILALGANDNATFALGRGDHALVSHHLGDLSNASSLCAYRAAITHYERLFGVEPELVVHDLHPDYASTDVARALGRERGVALLGVQHHHSHVVSCMVEHGLAGPVLGIACDGSGYGPDGTIWGGELLLCNRRSAQRVAHLRPVPMPGGERAVSEPWRMALAHLLDAEVSVDSLPSGVDPQARRVVSRMLERDFNCPRTSSVGRLFDAVSALCGVRLHSSYEGQPAIELEWAAMRSRAPAPAYPYRIAPTAPDAPLVLDTRELIRAVAHDVRAGVPVAAIALRFHVTLAAAWCQLCIQQRAEHGLSQVVLGGGVFANALLVTELTERLTRESFQVFRAHAHPAGDGGLCLGQLAIAAARDGWAA
ncbi:MAG: carbamoyltransferase HypF [Polyangiaceae bacterium]